MKILFLSTRAAKPSYRFRVQQMLPFFEQHGCACETIFMPRSGFGRLNVYRRAREFDVVVLQKRLLCRTELSLLRRASRRLIYDFDDAVMYGVDGRRNRRSSARFAATASAADLVIAGNGYLAGLASQYTDRIDVIPTAIDTEAFHPRLRRPKPDRITIGWTGSSITNSYLNPVLPVIARLGGPVEVKIISDSTQNLNLNALGRVPYTFVPWSPSVEATEAATFDIGLMPLPDDAWTRGKCGFKALQYMALGIPAVCSPVGANCEIIDDGENGFMPGTSDDWEPILYWLTSLEPERQRSGKAGRKRVEDAYSLKLHGPRLLDAVCRTVDPDWPRPLSVLPFDGDLRVAGAGPTGSPGLCAEARRGAAYEGQGPSRDFTVPGRAE